MRTTRWLCFAVTGKVVKDAQIPGIVPADEPWEDIEAADRERKILLHQLLAGVEFARRHRFGSAVATILRGIRHTNGKLKEPFRSEALTTAIHRRSIAVIFLETLIALGPALDAITLRAAYEHCRATLDSSTDNPSITKIVRGKKFALFEKYTCDILLRTAKLTSK